MDHHTCSRATAVPCRIDYFIRRRPHSLQRTRRAALRARAAGGVLLAFDFDGTLAPIANRPERAHDRAHAKAAGSGSTGALALRTRGVVLTLSLGLCFVLAYLALLAGLAPIVGAFAAGLVLEEVHFEGQAPRGEVGLIFAGIGAQLVFADRPVIDAGTYAAAGVHGRGHDDGHAPGVALVFEEAVM